MKPSLRGTALLTAAAAAGAASAQVPDLMTAFDAGSRAMAMGGGTAVTDTSTFSGLNNPATLAYIRKPEWGIAYRNLPTSDTNVSGDFNNRTSSATGFLGKSVISHIGYAGPTKGGVFNLSYTVGGYEDNTTFGNGLTDNSLTVNGLLEVTHAQTDFLTAGFGKTVNDLNEGVSLIVAHQYVSASQAYALVNSSGTTVGTVNNSASGSSYGLGLVLGVQGFNQAQATTWGLSLRTPITLSGSSDTSDYYNRIPGKISAGFAGRVAPHGTEGSFLNYGYELDYYYGGNSNKVLSRKNYLAGGVGVEYNYAASGYRMPIRLGFDFSPSGGNGYDDRNALTFGLGYKPTDANYDFNLTFARPSQGGPWDMALGVTFRPGN